MYTLPTVRYQYTLCIYTPLEGSLALAELSAATFTQSY
jgi:hypothetical protein